MLDKLPRIADMLLGFTWGAVVFWIAPQLIRERRENRKVNRWWTKTDVKGMGESTQWK